MAELQMQVCSLNTILPDPATTRSCMNSITVPPEQILQAASLKVVGNFMGWPHSEVCMEMAYSLSTIHLPQVLLSNIISW